MAAVPNVLQVGLFREYVSPNFKESSENFEEVLVCELNKTN